MPDSALPENLSGKKHWDWPWPFSLIPRGWTAFKWDVPTLVFGNIKARDFVNNGYGVLSPKPITSPGTWQISRFAFEGAPWYAWYFAFTLKSGRHFRVGARWDDVDDYVQFPTIAWRKYQGGDAQNTGTGPMKGR